MIINLSKRTKIIVYVLILFVLLIGIMITVVTQNLVRKDSVINNDNNINSKSDKQISANNTLPTKPAEQTQKKTATSDNTWPVVLSKSESASIAVVVNKKYKLSSDYVPANLVSVQGGALRKEAADAINQLLKTANNNGLALKIISEYRSYYEQSVIYNNYVNIDGQSLADTYSARPGHSEHQTGLAVDVGYINGNCSLEICFGETDAGKWLANNAHLYGFIIRYPLGKESITGYQYEPWHLRYLGLELAQSVKQSSKTLDEYFGVAAGGYN